MPLIVSGTDSITLPVGTTAQRNATPVTGMQRLNSTTGVTEYYNGTNWLSASIISGTSQATTSGTSVTFTGIPSGVKRITVNFVGVSQSGTTQMEVKLGTFSGVVTTGYVSGAASGLSATASSTSTTGFRIRNTLASDDIYGSMFISNQTGNTWVCSYSMTGSNGAFYTGAGSITLGGTLDRVQIAPNSADTFDAGSINILYE